MVESTTVEPVNAMLLSFASLSWTVIVVLLVPLATIVAEAGTMVERVVEIV